MYGDVVCEIDEACVNFLELYTHRNIATSKVKFFYFISLYMISEKVILIKC